MRHIKAVEDLSQNALFDSATLDAASWWVTDLTDSARRRLEESWPGVFRRSLLKLMPAQQLGAKFSPDFGRPTKELHAMAALVFIMEFNDWTVEDAVDAYTFNNSIHYALHLSNRHNYLCARTLEDYRKRVREDECAGEVFVTVTQTLIQMLDLDIKRQRLDSTHLLSDMATFGRTKLLGVTVKRLLTALKRHVPNSHAALRQELRERYEPSIGGLFGKASASKEGRSKTQQQIGQDMHLLIETYADDKAVCQRSTYKRVVRLFGEHFEVKDKRIIVRAKAVDSEGKSACTLQNPSDPEAGYDGHKGAGYQVQLAETSAQGNPAQLIVACVPQSASEQDSQALELVLAQQERGGLRPEELAADTAYGSDENDQRAKGQGITLISPVPGKAPEEGNQSEEARKDPEGPIKKHGRKQSTEQSRAAHEKAQRNAQRREGELSQEWKEKYGWRAGIESVNRGLDRRTGIKRLRVRGLRAVTHSVFGKVMGWNIIQSARAVKKQAIRARKAARMAGTEIEEKEMKPTRLVTWIKLAISRGIKATTSDRQSRQPKWPTWHPTAA